MAGPGPKEFADKFFGRRSGQTLRPNHARLVRDVLPGMRLPDDPGAMANPQNLFADPVREVWLEVGFGGGEHLAWQAGQHPDIGMIGAEPYINGVAKLLSQVESEGLTNVRIYDDDVRPRLGQFGPQTISRAFLLFPDPWPKTRHHKRRFVNQANLNQLHRILKPGAQFRVGSDIDGYIRHALREVQRHGGFEWTAEQPCDWRIRPDDWPQTRYEAKAEREGRTSSYLVFRRL